MGIKVKIYPKNFFSGVPMIMTENASYGQRALREGNVDREALVSEKSTQSVTNTAKRCYL